MERPKKATLKKISADKGGRVRRKTALPPDLHPKAQHEEVVPDKPLSVTVIIPYLSELAPARECLDSLRKQDEGIMEILIADVTPKPTLKALLKAVAAKDRRVVLMPQDRSAGRIHHLNEAIHIAKGEFIAIVDESVTVTAEWLEHLHVSMHRDKVTTIVGPLFTAGKEMQSVPPPSGKRKLEDEAAAFYMRNRDRRVTTTMVCGLCLLLKKDLIERINGFDPSFETEGGEIEDYCLRAEMEGFRVVIAADVLVGSTRDPVIRANGKAFVEKWSSHDAAGASGQRLRSWKIRMAAEQYEFAGRVDDAIAELKAGIAAFPQSKRLYTLLVWTYIRAKRDQEKPGMAGDNCFLSHWLGTGRAGKRLCGSCTCNPCDVCTRNSFERNSR
ncbi:MAG: glycosyltransferase family 2 protein [Ignavibacteriales bacterium]|nr:glycosyltransferase family 2 protein [Ignavibacteriales bacterium]